MSLLTILLLLQVMLPLGLLTWLVVAPARSRLGWTVQAAATGVVLLWLHAAAIWTVPPWWVLWLYAALWATGVAIGLRRCRRWPAMPHGFSAWSVAVALLAFGAFAASEAGHALAGRRAPAGPLQAMRFPLAGGTFLVVNGGDDIRINAHLESRDLPDPRFKAWRGNGYAVDLVAIDRWGLRASGLQPADNAVYRSFGWPVLSPCDAVVLTAIDGRPDMTPPESDTLEHLAGNHVMLACGGVHPRVHVVMAHFRQGSVRVRAGDAVQAGQPIAELGNSGGTEEAHLHIHVQRPGSTEMPMGGERLPATYFGRFLVRGDRVTVGTEGQRK
ncbi:MAG: M23 family metallopeptidase [Ramlibacter sp.]|nr:M23 family metallopeptidase [Ramlibacter sp.]